MFRLQQKPASMPFLLMSLGLAAMAPAVVGQETVRGSLAGSDAAASERQALIPGDYNIRLGTAGIRTEFSLGLEYNDNIFWSGVKRQSDFIIHPEVRLKSHWQVSRANTLTFGVGVGYDYYLDHTDLNPDRPLISPDSALAFNIYAGDFKINLHERFYYQESLSYGSFFSSGDVAINVNDIAVLGRYDNMAGVQVDWDLNDLLLTFSYDHENFWTAEKIYNYADRTSEWFKLSATFLFSPRFRLGLEGHVNYHDYIQNQIPDQWRIGGGPFVVWTLNQRVSLRVGGGYETFVNDDSQITSASYDNFYAYAEINHRLNDFITHALSVGHRNQLSFNGYNTEQTYAQYTAMWNILRNVDISTFISVFWASDFSNLYTEDYTYFQAGITLGYQLQEHWRANLGYTYTEKKSGLNYRDYYQNRVNLGLTYRF
jgi:hypothetical protein